jgi:hypothetical protein
MEKIIKIVRELIAGKFWGSLELKFEDGEVVHIKKMENIKP